MFWEPDAWAEPVSDHLTVPSLEVDVPSVATAELSLDTSNTELSILPMRLPKESLKRTEFAFLIVSLTLSTSTACTGDPP